MGSVYTGAHEVLGLRVLEMGVGLVLEGAKLCAARAIGLADGARGYSAARTGGDTGVGRSTEGLVSADGTAGGQGNFAIESAVDGDRGTVFDVETLTAIADGVFVNVFRFVGTIFRLALSSGRAEVAFFALASASHARRIVGVVDASQVATNLSTATRDTGLVNAFVLRCGRLGGSGCCRRGWGSSGGVC